MEEAEFEKLFKTYFSPLCSVAYAVVKDSDQARDIVQQVFIKFWDKRNSLKATDQLKSYLHKAVVNTSLNFIERAKKMKLEEDFSTYEKNIHERPSTTEEKQKEIGIKIKAAVAQLPEKCQLVFSLSRYEGMTNQEIASYLEISVKAVEKHIGRALKELRVSLKPYMEYISVFLFLEVGCSFFQLFS